MNLSCFLCILLNAEADKGIPEVERTSGHKGIDLSQIPIELKSGVWAVKVVPWIGGRIISMEHLPSGNAYVLIQIFS